MRVTNSPASRKRRGRMLTAAKGFRLKRSKLYRYASDAVDHGRVYAYRDRRTKKRNFRYLWQIRINAAVREAGLTYSRFMEGLKAAKVRARPQGARRPRRDRRRRVWRNHQHRQSRAEEQARRHAGQGRLNDFKSQISNFTVGGLIAVRPFCLERRPPIRPVGRDWF